MTELTAEQNEILDLRDQVFELEQMVRAFRSDDSDHLFIPTEWNLRPQERAVLKCLMTSPTGFRRLRVLHLVTSNKTIMESDPKVVQVVICRLRMALKRFDVEIKTVKNEGYCLPSDSLAALKRLLSEVRKETL